MLSATLRWYNPPLCIQLPPILTAKAPKHLVSVTAYRPAINTSHRHLDLRPNQRPRQFTFPLRPQDPLHNTPRPLPPSHAHSPAQRPQLCDEPVMLRLAATSRHADDERPEEQVAHARPHPALDRQQGRSEVADQRLHDARPRVDLADAALEVDQRGDAARPLDAPRRRGQVHEAPLQHVGHVAVPGVVHADDGLGAGDVEEARELAEGGEAGGQVGAEGLHATVSGADGTAWAWTGWGAVGVCRWRGRRSGVELECDGVDGELVALQVLLVAEGREARRRG